MEIKYDAIQRDDVTAAPSNRHPTRVQSQQCNTQNRIQSAESNLPWQVFPIRLALPDGTHYQGHGVLRLPLPEDSTVGVHLGSCRVHSVSPVGPVAPRIKHEISLILLDDGNQ